MSKTEIDTIELNELKRKAELVDKMKIVESFNISKKITSNAKNVNNASKTRLEEIKNIEQLVNGFINHSNEIKIMSDDSLNTSLLTSNESSNTIVLIQKLFDLVNHMSESIKEFSSTIEVLNKKNSFITELVESNGKISMQTNLLSINASIEASRAKEFGKGFAIVATEVKKLAAASKKSTYDIGREVASISKITEDVIKKNNQVQEFVLNSVDISKKAIEKLETLIKVSQLNSENCNMISTNVCKQLENSDSIKDKITKLIEDTKKAIDGSSTNIKLGESLLRNLNDREYSV